VPDESDTGTGATRVWVLEHLDEPIGLSDMARHAGMSVRTFTRRFREETGETAGTWLARARVDRARHLLETTDLPVDRVAAAAGFGTSASLRQHLAAAVGVSPLAYRRTYRSESA
jgi:transcriptional regulator GlxA family with amidase domain